MKSKIIIVILALLLVIESVVLFHSLKTEKQVEDTTEPTTAIEATEEHKDEITESNNDTENHTDDIKESTEANSAEEQITEDAYFYETNKDGMGVVIGKWKDGGMSRSYHDLYIRKDKNSEWKLVDDAFSLSSGAHSFALIGNKLYEVYTSTLSFQTYFSVMDVMTQEYVVNKELALVDYASGDPDNDEFYMEAEIVNHDDTSITVLWKRVDFENQREQLIGLIAYYTNGKENNVLFLK